MRGQRRRIGGRIGHRGFFRWRRLFRWPLGRRRWSRIFWWRFMLGGFLILSRTASGRHIKLRKEDVTRIEQSARKPADQLTEQELDSKMRQLDIKDFELTPEDSAYIAARPKVGCPACGAPLRGDENFCWNCGIQIPS